MSEYGLPDRCQYCASVCGVSAGFGQGCNGGDTIDVFHYMSEYGLPDETCMPYSATDHTAFETSGAENKRKICPAEVQEECRIIGV